MTAKQNVHNVGAILDHPQLLSEVSSFLTKNTLQVFATSSQRTLKDVYQASKTAWSSVDMAYWRPFDDEADPSDRDLLAALKRIQPGYLRRLRLQTNRCSDGGVADALKYQIGLEELSLDVRSFTKFPRILDGLLSSFTEECENTNYDDWNVSLSSSSSSSSGSRCGSRTVTNSSKSTVCSFLTGEALRPVAGRLRCLTVAGVTGAVIVAADAETSMLKELRLHNPSIADLEACARLPVLQSLEVQPPPISFNRYGLPDLPKESISEEILCRIFVGCPKLEHVHIAGVALLSRTTLHCILERLPALRKFTATCSRQALDPATVRRLKAKIPEVTLDVL
eukprot:TRINITY_DN68472_c0_g1_i1.p1 TRINITY_DN68472_c0_g1~~TRINITY_DN68472_c0_g1_i1.p1  ORF type:complete len:338 (+),score=41.29 TRINITY_DN68472_c0_g1_i1:53-1066(+)